MLESGALTLGNEAFQHCTLFVSPGAAGYVTRFVHEKGCFLPPGLTKMAARIYGNRGDTKITLIYLEDIGVRLSKMNWRTPGDVTSIQKEYIGKFNERFLAAFKFLRSGEAPERLPLIESQKIE